MSDLIRREDAIKVLKHHLDEDYLDGYVYLNELEALPSAEPKRKKGRWIEYPACLAYEGAYTDTDIVCSACHHTFNIMDNCTEEFDFCPHCGADMRGEE